MTLHPTVSRENLPAGAAHPKGPARSTRAADSLEQELRDQLGAATVLTAHEDLLACAFDDTAALVQVPRVGCTRAESDNT